VAVLRGHTGLVKGVTWDPVGKYLASQSDDKSLRIWRTRDWQQEAVITEPFKEVSTPGALPIPSRRVNQDQDWQFMVVG